MDNFYFLLPALLYGEREREKNDDITVILRHDWNESSYPFEEQFKWLTKNYGPHTNSHQQPWYPEL